MQTIRGVRAAPGVARAGWIRLEPTPVIAGGHIGPEAADPERARLREAMDVAADQLNALAGRLTDDGHPDEAGIFAAQAAIARDPALAMLADERIGRGDDAIAAIQAAAGSFADQLRAIGDELLAARAADVVDVGQRIARHLAGLPDTPVAGLDRPAIVVADDLPPSVTATFPRDRLLGIALEGSSATAHAAILARAYGIPAVVGATGLLAALGDATGPAGAARAEEIAIDGDTGEVVLDPDEPTRTRFDALAAAAGRRRDADLGEASLPATTTDGVAVALLANIGTPDECGEAIALGAAGVGLFRTEFLFLERASPPTEDEQLAAYRRVVEAFAPHPVTIRLLDVGGDKPIPFLPIAAEANPFLGVRALRLARTDPGVFVTQLRACLRAAAAGPVKVMAPMIAVADDVDLLLELADRARTELRAEGLAFGDADLGVMLEIPSAILVADSYFAQIRFASLGTNDLLQYTLAVDRGNAALERYRDSFHPAVLRLVRDAAVAADRAGIELSVCGEMAGDPPAALALVGLGVRSLSMAATSLAAVRRAIRAAAGTDLEARASAAIGDRSAAAARARFAALAARSSDA
jgi:phosphoenolpyruvate-protein phosphotransferase